MYALISGRISMRLLICITEIDPLYNTYTCYLSNPHVRIQGYLTKMLCTWSRLLSEVSISAKGYVPLLFAWAFNLYAKTETMTALICCVPSVGSLPRLFVGRLAIQVSFESAGCSVRAIFVTRTQVDKFETWSMKEVCAYLNWLSKQNRTGPCIDPLQRYCAWH